MTHRIILSVALFASLAGATQAQFSIGVAGGANLTFWEWHSKDFVFDLDLGPGIGLRAALQAEYRASELFSLRAELADQIFRSSTDVILTDQNGSPNGTGTQMSESYNSVGGSLLAKFSPLKKHRNFYILTGPTLAYITHAWRRIDQASVVEGRDLSKNQRLDLEERQIRRAQWLADFGMGYTFSIGEKNHLTVEARYQHGLTGFTESLNIASGIQTAALSFGYMRDL